MVLLKRKKERRRNETKIVDFFNQLYLFSKKWLVKEIKKRGTAWRRVHEPPLKYLDRRIKRIK
jgi:hypothetical protein